MSGWATTPIDLRRGWARRLFAQEFVSRLQQIGSATLPELEALPVLLFKVRPEPDELRQIADVARRLGWVEDESGAWRLTDAGRAVRPPPSLAIVQVLTRIMSVATPVRDQAKDWLPLLALVAGAVAAGSADNVSTEDVVRTLSAMVLAASVAWQFVGEVQIALTLAGWERVQQAAVYAPATALYRCKRLALALVLDLSLITAFTLLIFGVWWWWIAAAVGAVAGIVHVFAWTLPALVMVEELRGRPRRSGVLGWLTSPDRRFTPKPSALNPPRPVPREPPPDLP